MTTEAPPVLSLRSRSTAVTYSFRAADRMGGWACCTVNDATGELAITSDWGNWAHRWNISHLGTIGGRNTTLTEFLGGGSIDYIADKLMSRDQRDRFDADATVAAFRELLREKRRDTKRYGGHWMWKYTSEPYLDKDTARRLWDAIRDLAYDVESSPGAVDLFIERYTRRGMEDAKLVCDEPWNLIRTKPSGEYLALTKTVLPALVAACAAEAGAAPSAARDRVVAVLEETQYMLVGVGGRALTLEELLDRIVGAARTSPTATSSPTT